MVQNTPENNPPITPNKPTINWAKLNHNKCSSQTCKNNHTWTPQLAIPHCKGCKDPFIGLRMLNCPVCNEPPVTTRLRIDHLATAHPITAPCHGEYHIGPEYIFVQINHTHDAWNTSEQPATNPQIQNIHINPARLETEGNVESPPNSESDLDGCL